MNTATGTIVSADTSEEKNSEQAPITITIPVTQQSTANVNPPQNAPPPFRSGNRGRGRGRFFGKGGRRDYESGAGRSHTKVYGESYAYCMDVASLNIFENQVVPMGLHNLSKSFRPNIATTRVFSLVRSTMTKSLRSIQML